jgi:hypothetical protein
MRGEQVDIAAIGQPGGELADLGFGRGQPDARALVGRQHRGALRIRQREQISGCRSKPSTKRSSSAV